MLISYLITKATMQPTIKTSKTVLSIMLGTALLMPITGCDIKQRDEDKKNSQQHITKEKIIENSNSQAVLGEETAKQNTTELSGPNVVKIMEIALQDIPQTKDFSGFATSFETYEVHPEITGTITSIDFKQGYWVKVGEPLYHINPLKKESSTATKKSAIKKAEASLNSAISANKKALSVLKKSKTELTQARNDLNRYKKLIKDEAVSEQKYQQSVSEVKKAQSSIKSVRALVNQTNAEIKMAEANIELAKNQLNDDKKMTASNNVVRAPITGMVLNTSIRKGQKVIAENADSFVTIAKVNPIFVDIFPTAEELVQIKEMLVSPKPLNKKSTSKDNQTNLEITTPNITNDMVKKHEVSLVLENGESFAHSGTFKFSETKIDDENKITMRVLFPNNKGFLLPNMKVTAKVKMPTLTNIILLPMTSVMHMPTKTANKMVEQPTDAIKEVAHEHKNQPTVSESTTTTLNTPKSNGENNSPTKEATVKNRLELPTSTEQEIQSNHDFAHFVYVVDENNQTQLRPIQVGGTYNNQMIVAGGLLEGDKVVIDSDKKVEPKQTVIIN